MKKALLVCVYVVSLASAGLCGCAPPRQLARVARRAHETSQKADCLSNLKQLALGMLMFAMDHNEAFPNAKTWADDIRPYLKSDDVFHCPSDHQHEFSYAMNSQLSGKKIGDIADPTTTVLIFESETGKRNAADPLKSICAPPRHGDGNCFAYADGHVRFVTQP